MEAIILAGGFGTRLSHIVPDLPKPMAPINGRPFLEYVLDYLYRNDINRVVLAVGYKAEIIKKYFGNKYKKIDIRYSTEDIALGTGGAIKKALGACKEDNIFVINGDTYFDVDLVRMMDFHKNAGSNISIAIKRMNNFERFGSVIVEDNIIKKFEEKKPKVEGKVNGGIYIINRKIMSKIQNNVFSFENDILESGLYNLYAFESEGYFIDIGIPEDYNKAQMEL
ncbi:D-glycero-alpha-D-manno-heptose 1-phosphate guanylyltransferase [bioreactor metagenome]|uniref:D-glycero-alpha-D-manno-heptose 1-phosphate guanylyltransferase n=1 Tax=bioreactor metagenome TaxID=1076179 RepID=A0A644XY16_9ZZZZ